MFQCRKRQRGCTNIKYRMANTLLLSANMGFIAAGHQRATKLKNTKYDTNTKQPQHKDTGMVNIELLYWPYEQHLKNQDQDLEFIRCIFHIIVVNTTFSGWMYICFTVQHTCKCISLFMWHAIIVLQPASLITSAIQWPSSNTKPRDPLRLQYGEAPPHHRDLCPSLSWDIQT